MFEPFSAPHFRAVFRISAPLSRARTWADVVQTTFSWLAQNRNIGNLAAQLSLHSFAQDCDLGAGRHRLRTLRERGAGDEDAAQFWALRFEHPDSQVYHRRWRTDIGLTLAPDGVIDFSLALAHHLDPDYVGTPPDQPDITRPLLMRMLLRNAEEGWRFMAGSEPLSCTPVALPGDVAEVFWAAVTDPARTCPVVLLMPDKESGAYSLNPDRLADQLSGVAPVYAADRDAYYTLQRVVPETYQCHWQYVRIYSPGLTVANPLDYRRHRWFSHDHIGRETPARIERMIVQSLVRSEARVRTPILTTLEDVKARALEIRLQQMHAARLQQQQAAENEQNEDKDLIGMLEEENNALAQKVASLEAELAQKKEAEELSELSKLIEDDSSDASPDQSDRVRDLEYRLRYALARADALKLQNEVLEKRTTAIATFMTLPDSLSEIIDMIERLHAGRIVFTSKARKSAEEATFDDLHKTWNCLSCVATTLWELYFDQEQAVGELDQLFRDATGFLHAQNEGAATMRNPRLMELRRDIFEGEKIEYTPHVSIGTRAPKLLRIYYCADRKRRRIIVGHCGNHLETDGTRVRQE